MAVKDKKKMKNRNQAQRKPSNAENHVYKSKKSKPKRVEVKKQNPKSKKGKGKNRKQKNKEKPKKTEVDLKTKLNNFKRTIMRSKQLIFWIVLVSIMFFLRFNEEGFGAFQQMRSSEDLYKVLESESHFSAKQIKKQYRKLVAQFHPDTNPNCAICEDKITSINKAYEVLKDPASRKIYDQTKGIVDPIRSAAKNLDKLSFRKKVIEGNRPLIIQIYAENSERSRSFSGFWEDFMIEHSYLDFARINMSTEIKLANSLGFGVEELPFVFSYVPGRDYEFFELNEYYEGSTSVLLNRFVKKVVKRNAETITFQTFLRMERQPNQISIIFVRREYSPLVYEYLALRFKQYPQVKFYTTALNEHKKFYNHFKKYDIDYVMLMPKDWDYGTRVISIDAEAIQAGGNVSSEEEEEESEKQFYDQKVFNNEEFKTPKKILKHYIVTNYLKSQMIPSLQRHSFVEFCKKDFTSFDGQLALPTVCIIGLKGGTAGDFETTMQKLDKLRTQLESQAYDQMTKSQENFNLYVHRFQFASVNLDDHPKFSQTLVESLPVKNPRVMIYLSESDQFMLLNSFQDLDDIVEDAQEGIFQDYRSYRAMLSKDVPIEELLLNENISLLGVLSYEVNQLFWRAIGFLVLILIVNSYFVKIPNDKLIMGYVVVLALFLGFVVTEKMFRELVW
jgi:curved DNA-binding protein CbpA